ncbi:Lipopolysaccharide kinase (Kdo/WaaP) family protein [Kytococcus aerolatus]|uniref:Lipopolysaccharide kinase (Kdo/WaaP) family protein n=1 Tax=Kytococcus aerolatus TaxID=592308 RepID=A0A212U5U9_9MICO|nr:DUF4032 domain-containing protein [Kytococcus aerolatus]SNC73607.1 Lipopolysaccharide kinase (Kdo/WaaP) family protein [Kytococcus aerolatus]
MALDITAARLNPGLFALPWSTPLEEWPLEVVAALPRGISRHVVRFVELEGEILAVKEIHEDLARKEYRLLHALDRMGEPAVDPVAVVAGRTDAAGRPLDACLVTKHLPYSLPYRSLFSQSLRRATALKLIDAMAVLLTRVHMAGLFWGDVSLSNTLFRRDAGDFAAYVVDVETSELYDRLSDGQRAHDLHIAHGNVAGELMDLIGGGLLPPEADPVAIADQLVERYEGLWTNLTETETISMDQHWRIAERIESLNRLGFDVGEIEVTTDIDGAHLRIQPKIVDAGHHSRRLMRLTGLDVEENQARRLLNDLDAFAASQGRQNDDESLLAHDWLSRIYEPITRTVPAELRGRLEPAELFHEVLEHRWYLSERADREYTIEETIGEYLRDVLPSKRTEEVLLAPKDGAGQPD